MFNAVAFSDKSIEVQNALYHRHSSVVTWLFRKDAYYGPVGNLKVQQCYKLTFYINLFKQ